jgi:glutathione S-transferase
MPADRRSRCEALERLFAALNSVDTASLAWSIWASSGDTGDAPGWRRLDEFLEARLQHLEPVLAGREWLAGTFSVVDTYSWRTCCALSIGSTGWRDT